jgi:hypothetical protein
MKVHIMILGARDGWTYTSVSDGELEWMPLDPAAPEMTALRWPDDLRQIEIYQADDRDGHAMLHYVAPQPPPPRFGRFGEWLMRWLSPLEAT